MTLAEKLTAVAENQQAVYDAGAEKGERDWWEYYQSEYRGHTYQKLRTNYLYAFAGPAWDDGNYHPIHPITPTTNAQNIYSYSGITDTKVSIDLTGDVLSNCYNMFAYATKLKTVRLLRVSDKVSMSNHFTECTALENLTVEGVIAKNAYFHWCKHLTTASMKSVIGCLKNFSGTGSENTCTLKFHADCWARLEAEGAAPNGSTWKSYVQSLGWVIG